MFDNFGEFDSVEELNLAAAGLKEEGDKESLISLAVENGIDREDAADYLDGCTDELATPLMAALGKLEVEKAELKPVELVEDWVEYIRVQIVEHEEMAKAFRKKGKSMKECIGKLLAWSFKNAYAVDADIVKAAGIKTASVKMGFPGMARAKKIIIDYYMG